MPLLFGLGFRGLERHDAVSNWVIERSSGVVGRMRGVLELEGIVDGGSLTEYSVLLVDETLVRESARFNFLAVPTKGIRDVTICDKDAGL